MSTWHHVTLKTTLRARAYSFIKSRGNHGATADEVAERLLGKQQAQSRRLNTIRARVSELNKQGVILDSGNTRQNAIGNRCSVWVVVPENDAAHQGGKKDISAT
jgi:hypothetical protein